ncbi:hypothetical protein CPB85DRAFT_1258498, partial [Mucidula mucida]
MMRELSRDWLSNISPGNPPDHLLYFHRRTIGRALSTHSPPICQSSFRALHYLSREINKDLKRKASSDSADPSSKQRKLEKDLPIIVKNFDWRQNIGSKGPQRIADRPSRAFHTNNQISIVVDQTRMLFRKECRRRYFDWWEQAVDKYRTVPGMESLGEVIVGCTSCSEALRRLLHYISEHRSMVDVHNSETVIMVEGYDLAARIGHSSDITAAASPSHVSLAE